jgi:hypothetical protein
VNLLALSCLFFAALTGFGGLAPAQEQDTPAPGKTASGKKAPAADVFSGTVTKLTQDSISVVREVPGHDAVTHSFVRDAQTKVEGKLRERARVTVRYKAGEEGVLVAVYIIVR